MEFQHVPVLLQEVLDGLAIRPDGIYVDGTVGGAGHSREIAKRLTAGGQLIGFDRDPDAVAAATERLAGYPATVVHHNYDEMQTVLTEMGLAPVDGVLLDLGVSSHQLDEESRGFSYHADAPLDMRMSQTGMTAEELVNTISEEELARILFTYGEESFARSIARRIVQARQEKPIHTTLELAELIKSGVPQKVRRMKNPCKKSFQAIRIAVNGEFEHLEAGLQAAFSVLKVGGRPYGQTAVCRMVSGLYLPAGFPAVRLRQNTGGKAGHQKAHRPRRSGAGAKQSEPQCEAACLGKEPLIFHAESGK